MTDGEKTIAFLVVLGLGFAFWAAAKGKGHDAAGDAAKGIFGNLALRAVIGIVIVAMIALVKLIASAF